MITTEQILVYSPDKNYDPSLLDAVLEGAKLAYIRKMLGVDFYTELETQYDAGTLTTANDTFLVNYLQPILAYYCLYDSMVLLNAEPTANGVVSMYADRSQSAEPSAKARANNFLISRAETLVEVAKEYLKDNATLYPLYKCGKDITLNSWPILERSKNEVQRSKNV